MEFQEYIIVSLTWVSPSLLVGYGLTLITTISEIVLLKEAFFGLTGTKLSNLKNLHSEVFTKIHWGRLMVLLNFAEQLDLSVEEWEQLFDFLVSTLTQIEENV